MPVRLEDYANACVISVDGDFVGAEPSALRELVAAQFKRRGSPNLVIDFHRAGFLSSQGLETLLETRRQCESRRGQLKLVGLDENCRKILDLTRLAHRFECHAELAGAMKGL